jgi:hypothetical protein
VKVDVSVASQTKTEVSDKPATFKVTLQGATLDNVEVKLSLRGETEKLFEMYPLNEFFSVTLTKPQQKLTEPKP